MPPSGPGNVAFLVLNHREPAQLTRLVSVLRAQLPDAPIAVHHDVYQSPLPSRLPDSVPGVHLLASGKRVAWGDFSQVDIVLWSLTWMRRHLDFEWVVLLSAQDYPIKPLAGLAADLGRDGADAVFRGTRVSELPLASRTMMRRRYYFRYGPDDPRWRQRIPGRLREGARPGLPALLRGLNNLQPAFKAYRLAGQGPYRVGRRALHTPFDRDWPCWHASSWFALSGQALAYVLDYVATRPDYARFYRRTLCPDESMVASLVFNDPRLRVANRDVTHTRWPGPMASHPDVFQSADYGELAAAAPYFARKFDVAVDEKILDALDELIGHTASGSAKVEV